jgi:4-amino-4-deoxy-L-arabinose transferase-like glycosyltransferase
MACLGMRRYDRHEQCAFTDPSADHPIPGVPAAQLALVESDFDPGCSERVSNALRGRRVFRGVVSSDADYRVRSNSHCSPHRSISGAIPSPEGSISTVASNLALLSRQLTSLSAAQDRKRRHWGTRANCLPAFGVPPARESNSCAINELFALIHNCPVSGWKAPRSSEESRDANATRTMAWVAILFIVTSLFYIGTAFGPALLDDDVDAAHAVVVREMLERQDYIVLYQNGVRYLFRPPLHFWMIAASYTLFGQTEFATHLPLALTVVALLLLVFEFGRRFFSLRVGLYGVLILASSPGLFIFTRTVSQEAICAVEFIAVFYLFLRAWTGSLEPRLGYWGAAVLCGAAVLTRGLVGIIFPVATIAVFITVTGAWRRWRELRPFSSLLIFLAVAAPWHILSEIRAPGFLWAYFVNDHFKRALGTRWPPDYSAVPLGLWWAAHLLWLFPWAFFTPVVVRDLLASRMPERNWSRTSQARILLFSWAGVILLFFSAVGGSRMEYYSLAAWPGITLLLAAALARSEQTGDRWLRGIQRALAVLGIVLAIVLVYLLMASSHEQTTGDISLLLQSHDASFYRFAMGHVFDLTVAAFADLRAPSIIAALALLMTFITAWILRERDLQAASTIVMSAGMLMLLFAANMAYGRFESQLSSRSLAMELRHHLRHGDRLVIYGDFAAGSSLAFYTHRQLCMYRAPYSNLEYGSHFPDAPKIFLNDEDFSSLWKGSNRVFLIVPSLQLPSARARLPLHATWLFTESGGKTALSNRPLKPGQLSMAEITGQQIKGKTSSLSGGTED